MGGVFDSRNFEQSAQQRDTELTLTSTTVLLMIVALVALCGLCFGLGYATGRRGSAGTESAAVNGSTAGQTDSGQSKPAANMQSGTGGASKADAPAEPDPTSSDTSADAGTAAEDSSVVEPQVKPALSAVNPAQTGQVATGSVGPALAQPGQVMVQVAAVGQKQDADVLVSALLRRGYAVSARREPLDGLIHVKIGPFKTAAEAENWRQKLLNDGYNAEIQQ